MKTSTIEVRDMLSVLGVDELEKRIVEVPGIESATVNFAEGSATVRYDETRIESDDIKSAVRQRGYEPGAAAGDDHQTHTGTGTPEAPAPAASASSAEQPKAASSTASKPPPAVPAAPPAPMSATPKSPPDAAATASGAHAGHEAKGKTAPDKH